MNYIQNTCIGAPTLFNKTIASFTCVITITVIALSVIGVAVTPSGPCNAIVQFGTTTNGILLGTSIFVFILDLVWMAALFKKRKDPIDYFNQQSDEAILEIFRYLSPIELARCGEVNKQWYRLVADTSLWNAFDLKKCFPFLTIFDEKTWEKHFDLAASGLSIGDIPPVDKRRVIPKLEQLLSFKMDNVGAALLLMPPNLTMETLITIAGKPTKEGHTGFAFMWDTLALAFAAKNRDTLADSAYWILVTNEAFEGTHELSTSEQQTYLKNIGWEMPHLLEAATFIVMNAKENITKRDPKPAHTCCLERFNKDRATISGMYPDHFRIAYLNPQRLLAQSIGVFGVVRERSFQT